MRLFKIIFGSLVFGVTSVTRIQARAPFSGTETLLSCGKRIIDRSPKIVGGSDAYHGEFPWMVSLYIKGEPKCGGAIISRRWILTASHCIYKSFSQKILLNPLDLKIGVGEFHKNQMQFPDPVLYDVSSIEPYPLKSFQRVMDADLALILLSETLWWTPYVRPICLPNLSDEYVDMTGKTATVIGWGRKKEGEGQPLAEALQKVDLNVMDTKQCYRWYDDIGYHFSNQTCRICAGFEHGKKDSCNGDSGGPLMTKDAEGRYTVIGLVSWGIGCAREKQLGLYTEISCYLPWIYSALGKR